MKFRNATLEKDRPERMKDVIVRSLLTGEVNKMQNLGHCNGWNVGTHHEFKWDNTEWLDETPVYVEGLKKKMSAFVFMFNQGYGYGHQHTVEGGYTDVHHTDMNTYHDDLVQDIIDGSDYLQQLLLPSTKSSIEAMVVKWERDDIEIDTEFRSIISHGLLGTDNNISREAFDLIINGCVKYFKIGHCKHKWNYSHGESQRRCPKCNLVEYGDFR